MQNDTSKESMKHGQEGSGSAENTGKDRSEQNARMAEIDEDQKKDIASQTGLKPDNIADLKDLHALSGRDDQAGGSGDQMENTSSNEPTDRF